jgi:hypothetical protein
LLLLTKNEFLVTLNYQGRWLLGETCRVTNIMFSMNFAVFFLHVLKKFWLLLVTKSKIISNLKPKSISVEMAAWRKNSLGGKFLVTKIKTEVNTSAVCYL